MVESGKNVGKLFSLVSTRASTREKISLVKADERRRVVCGLCDLRFRAASALSRITVVRHDSRQHSHQSRHRVKLYFLPRVKHLGGGGREGASGSLTFPLAPRLHCSMTKFHNSALLLIVEELPGTMTRSDPSFPSAALRPCPPCRSLHGCGYNRVFHAVRMVSSAALKGNSTKLPEQRSDSCLEGTNASSAMFVCLFPLLFIVLATVNRSVYAIGAVGSSGNATSAVYAIVNERIHSEGNPFRWQATLVPTAPKLFQ